MFKFQHKLLFLFVTIGISAVSQNFIDKYLASPLAFNTLATNVNGITLPRDLEFKPNTSELWVANYDGSIVMLFNAGLSNQSHHYRKDTHAGHFMINTSAIAMSDIGELANTNEIQNTNFPSSTFMGPALWSTDTNIFARVFQNNWQGGFPLGSHIDMLHQSPFSMGIAHEDQKIYWVFDGHNGNLCKYDYVMDHGPGYDNHSAGKIWRYTDIPLSRVSGVPSHMVMDKNSKWLYIVDGGTKSLIRVNTNTGTVGANLPMPNTGAENIALYKAVTGATKETIATYTDQPCGIDYDNDRLIVGSYDTGLIRVYNTSGASPVLLGTIATGQPGMMGLKIGYDGRIWFVNHTQQTVVRIDLSAAVNDVTMSEVIFPKLISYESDFHSPAYDQCGLALAPIVAIRNTGSANLTSANLSCVIDGVTTHTMQWTGSLVPGATTTVQLPSSFVSPGAHKFEAHAVLPNGVADENPRNNIKQGGYRAMGQPMPLPFQEDFTLSNFPPAGWSYLGFNKFAGMSWNAVVDGYQNGAGSLQMDNVSGGVDITGQTDYLISPIISFSNTGWGTTLMFDVAYAQYNLSSNDALVVKASTDCGLTWSQVWSQSGSTLATAPPTTGIFVPDFAEWKTETINLDAFAAQSEVIFLFTSISNFGNNFYLDNIKINHMPTLGISKTTKVEALSIYPVPTTDLLNIKSPSPITQVEIINCLGVIVAEKTLSVPVNETSLDLISEAAGTFFVRIKTQEGLEIRKFVIHKN